jgi:hypothetical protein
MAKQYRQHDSRLWLPTFVDDGRPWYQSRRCPTTMRFGAQRMRACCCDESSSSEESWSESSSSSSETHVNCAGCCAFSGHDSVGVDLGNGGWTNGACNHCVDVKGQFVTSLNHTGSYCGWDYRGWTSNTPCSPYDMSTFTLRLAIGTDVPNRFWLRVGYPATQSEAQYRSQILSDPSDCFADFVGGRLAMTKTSDWHTLQQFYCPSYHSYYYCQGSLPSTIYLFEA